MVKVHIFWKSDHLNNKDIQEHQHKTLYTVSNTIKKKSTSKQKVGDKYKQMEYINLNIINATRFKDKLEQRTSMTSEIIKTTQHV
jgi:hypothetical protein